VPIQIRFLISYLTVESCAAGRA